VLVFERGTATAAPKLRSGKVIFLDILSAFIMMHLVLLSSTSLYKNGEQFVSLKIGSQKRAQM
jgi:hypothetical protein